MNEYTIEDIKILAQVYDDENSSAIGLTPEEISQFGGAFSYQDLMGTIIKEKETPEDSLMEFLGAYESVVFDEISRKRLHDFLFTTPLEEMPLHINDKDTFIWRFRVAIWRLRINK
jgi:hypothetical protein